LKYGAEAGNARTLLTVWTPDCDPDVLTAEPPSDVDTRKLSVVRPVAMT
jgi:hypothetical protein